MQLPGPLGMILVGIAVGNISKGNLVKGLPASWSKELRAIALAIIFLRSGLELDLRVSHHPDVLCFPVPTIKPVPIALCTWLQMKLPG